MINKSKAHPAVLLFDTHANAQLAGAKSQELSQDYAVHPVRKLLLVNRVPKHSTTVARPFELL